MVKKKNKVEIEVVYAGTPEQTRAIFRSLLKNTIEGVFHRNGVIAKNLDEVLDKYVSEEILISQRTARESRE
ncbi:hypothetical protein MKZ15_05765 [Paenibacillus sp. FSL R7-0216]|uniref:hypothetical protein n=1 Tax=Paenibacillus sp. FSL R7-0216 TaxID=2921677 RepID=UPI0030DB8173